MSSHREAPSISGLTALAGIPTLADLQTTGIAALEELTHQDVSTDNSIDWHTNLNITDLYIFRKPGDERKTILIMNVNPMPPKLADAFDPTALYEFRIDTNGDAVADIGFRITFSEFEHGKQVATVRRATGTQATSDGNSGEIIIAHAPVAFDENARISESGSYRFFAGIRSDPFFFDLMGFCNNSRFTGNDYFSDKEVFGIVLEVPNAALGEQSKVGIWSRVLWSHHEDWLQVARLGLPLVNILFNTSQQKDLFNRTEPDKQKALFTDSFVTVLESLGHSSTQAQKIALVFLPDILQYDYSSEQGFFNGRKLTDDVVDSVLNLVTGGKVTTDMVGPHTDYFTTFPYLGQPHGR
jgi:hypothetical protein